MSAGTSNTENQNEKYKSDLYGNIEDLEARYFGQTATEVELELERLQPTTAWGTSLEFEFPDSYQFCEDQLKQPIIVSDKLQAIDGRCRVAYAKQRGIPKLLARVPTEPLSQPLVKRFAVHFKQDRVIERLILLLDLREHFLNKGRVETKKLQCLANLSSESEVKKVISILRNLSDSFKNPTTMLQHLTRLAEKIGPFANKVNVHSFNLSGELRASLGVSLSNYFKYFESIVLPNARVPELGLLIKTIPFAVRWIQKDPGMVEGLESGAFQKKHLRNIETRKAFEAWLDQQPAGATCPLAQPACEVSKPTKRGKVVESTTTPSSEKQCNTNHGAPYRSPPSNSSRSRQQGSSILHRSSATTRESPKLLQAIAKDMTKLFLDGSKPMLRHNPSKPLIILLDRCKIPFFRQEGTSLGQFREALIVIPSSEQEEEELVLEGFRYWQKITVVDGEAVFYFYMWLHENGREHFTMLQDLLVRKFQVPFGEVEIETKLTNEDLPIPSIIQKYCSGGLLPSRVYTSFFESMIPDIPVLLFGCGTGRAVTSLLSTWDGSIPIIGVRNIQVFEPCTELRETLLRPDYLPALFIHSFASLVSKPWDLLPLLLLRTSPEIPLLSGKSHSPRNQRGKSPEDDWNKAMSEWERCYSNVKEELRQQHLFAELYCDNNQPEVPEGQDFDDGRDSDSNGGTTEAGLDAEEESTNEREEKPQDLISAVPQEEHSPTEEMIASASRKRKRHEPRDVDAQFGGASKTTTHHSRSRSGNFSSKPPRVPLDCEDSTDPNSGEEEESANEREDRAQDSSHTVQQEEPSPTKATISSSSSHHPRGMDTQLGAALRVPTNLPSTRSSSPIGNAGEARPEKRSPPAFMVSSTSNIPSPLGKDRPPWAGISYQRAAYLKWIDSNKGQTLAGAEHSKAMRKLLLNLPLFPPGFTCNPFPPGILPWIDYSVDDYRLSLPPTKALKLMEAKCKRDQRSRRSRFRLGPLWDSYRELKELIEKEAGEDEGEGEGDVDVDVDVEDEDEDEDEETKR